MASISPFIHLSCFFFYFQKFPLEKFSLWHEKNKMIVRTCCFYCFTIEQFPIECGKYDFGFALLCCVNGPEYLSHYFKHFSFSLECRLSTLTLCTKVKWHMSTHMKCEPLCYWWEVLGESSLFLSLFVFFWHSGTLLLRVRVDPEVLCVLGWRGYKVSLLILFPTCLFWSSLPISFKYEFLKFLWNLRYILLMTDLWSVSCRSQLLISPVKLFCFHSRWRF